MPQNVVIGDHVVVYGGTAFLFVSNISDALCLLALLLPPVAFACVVFCFLDGRRWMAERRNVAGRGAILYGSIVVFFVVNMISPVFSALLLPLLLFAYLLDGHRLMAESKMK